MKGMLRAAVGFAADDQGNGVAYVRIAGSKAERVLRVPFGVKRLGGLRGREVGYAALHAVATVLRRHVSSGVTLLLDDPGLADDLREHREVPSVLTLAYVRLRCALNQFAQYEIAEGEGESDLTARARSELAMHVAA